MQKFLVACEKDLKEAEYDLDGKDGERFAQLLDKF